MSATFKSYYKSPIGLIEITCTNEAVTSLFFIEESSQVLSDSCKYLNSCISQMDEYFEGTRQEFDLNLNPGGTEFQKKVWNQLLKIPYGSTESYLWQSKMLGDPLAIRAVAKANGENKISIIIPCHRVIGTDGSLTGYAGGLWRKKWLLDHERKYFNGEKQLDLF